MSNPLNFISKKDKLSLEELEAATKKIAIDKRNAYWEINRNIEQSKKRGKKPKKPFYLYPDSQNTFNMINPEYLYDQIKGKRYIFVFETLGIIANRYRILGQLTEDQQLCLDLAQELLELALEKKNVV